LTLPIRHPSEKLGSSAFGVCKSLDPSFRWDDDVLTFLRGRRKHAGQLWAFAWM